MSSDEDVKQHSLLNNHEQNLESAARDASKGPLTVAAVGAQTNSNNAVRANETIESFKLTFSFASNALRTVGDPMGYIDHLRNQIKVYDDHHVLSNLPNLIIIQFVRDRIIYKRDNLRKDLANSVIDGISEITRPYWNDYEDSTDDTDSRYKTELFFITLRNLLEIIDIKDAQVRSMLMNMWKDALQDELTCSGESTHYVTKKQFLELESVGRSLSEMLESENKIDEFVRCVMRVTIGHIDELLKHQEKEHEQEQEQEQEEEEEQEEEQEQLEEALNI